MPRKTASAAAGAPPRPLASMRPRPDAAENRAVTLGARCARSSFNEAAARCRGKHDGRGAGRRRCVGFNEAAARCRGKLRLGRTLEGATDLLQ